MLPSLSYLSKLAGLDPNKVLCSMAAKKDANFRRTVHNLLKGKSNPRRTTIQRFFEFMVSHVSGVGCDKFQINNFEKLVHGAMDNDESDYFLEWESFFQCFKLSEDPRPWLLIKETQRFVELTRQNVDIKDPQTLAQALSGSDIPKTKITLKAIGLMQDANHFSKEMMQKTMAPIVFTNILYLIACVDTEQELLIRLCPVFGQTRVTLPIERWLNDVRKDRCFKSDKALGEFIFPQWNPDNAGREIKRWRKGSIPSWKTIQKFKSEDGGMQVETVFAIIKIIHEIYNGLLDIDLGELGFDTKTLFDTAPQLQALAKDRESKLIHTS